MYREKTERKLHASDNIEYLNFKWKSSNNKMGPKSIPVLVI